MVDNLELQPAVEKIQPGGTIDVHCCPEHLLREGLVWSQVCCAHCEVREGELDVERCLDHVAYEEEGEAAR